MKNSLLLLAKLLLDDPQGITTDAYYQLEVIFGQLGHAELFESIRSRELGAEGRCFVSEGALDELITA
ncbi:MAG: hypothetical protein EBU90_27395 [Proteobacteria bacterium]|nr:hypothetical protein [Pseudomonadota bacterium]